MDGDEMTFTVNGNRFALPDKPLVLVCLDGTAPAYLEAARDVMPNLEGIRRRGVAGVARSVIPSFTNPNNLALVTGVPPSVNGICGNFYYDRERDREVMMNDPAFLRCPTVLAGFADAGRSVAMVTAKDKLRRLLGAGLGNGICFSVEKAHEATEAENGIGRVPAAIGRDNPGVYDPECSVYCLEAGSWLLRNRLADVLYLSTTDYVQHKWPPEAEEARAFYARMDRFLGEIEGQGVVLGITADHGMNDKTFPDGSPRVRYLESLLADRGVAGARVILPITDPYVVHHGALGSFATVYIEPGRVAAARRVLAAIPGVDEVLVREEAEARFSLPGDRIGDLVVLGDRHTVFGRTPEWHDLSAVRRGLRSHGGLHEREVPFILNRPLKPEYAGRLRGGLVDNYEILGFLCNGTLPVNGDRGNDARRQGD